MISCLTPEQIALQDPDVCVQGVWDQEGIVPRPFSQLHPLCPLPGHGLYHLWVHEAGPPPELVVVFIPTKSKPVCSESSNRSNRETEYQAARETRCLSYFIPSDFLFDSQHQTRGFTHDMWLEFESHQCFNGYSEAAAHMGWEFGAMIWSLTMLANQQQSSDIIKPPSHSKYNLVFQR